MASILQDTQGAGDSKGPGLPRVAVGDKGKTCAVPSPPARGSTSCIGPQSADNKDTDLAMHSAHGSRARNGKREPSRRKKRVKLGKLPLAVSDQSSNISLHQIDACHKAKTLDELARLGIMFRDPPVSPMSIPSNVIYRCDSCDGPATDALGMGFGAEEMKEGVDASIDELQQRLDDLSNFQRLGDEMRVQAAILEQFKFDSSFQLDFVNSLPSEPVGPCVGPSEKFDLVACLQGWLCYKQMWYSLHGGYANGFVSLSGLVLPVDVVIVDPGSLYRAKGNFNDGYVYDSLIAPRLPFQEIQHPCVLYRSVPVSAEAQGFLGELYDTVNSKIDSILLGNWIDRTNPLFGYFVRKNDLMVHRDIFAYLCEERLAASFSISMAKILLGTVARLFKMIPTEVQVQTLIYFVTFRAKVQVQSFGPSLAYEKFLTSGRWTFVAPINQSDLHATLDSNSPVTPGVYDIITPSEELRRHSQGRTVAARLSYGYSSDVYGSYDEPKLLGGRFRVKRAEGCKFKDPYVKFNTRNHIYTPAYQTVGFAFATNMRVLDHNSVEEYEKCLLRLTTTRIDERSKTHNQRLCLSRIHVPDVHRVSLEDSCQRYDSKYSLTSSGHRSDSPLANLVEKFFDVRRLVFCDEGLAKAQFDYLTWLDHYIDAMGVKLSLRRALLQQMRDDPHVYVSKNTVFQMKPHEPQKFKNVDGDLVCKYGRAVASLSDTAWVAANPAVPYYMKIMIENSITIRSDGLNVNYNMAGLLGNIVEIVPVACEQFNYWYRTVLYDTSAVELALVVAEMEDFCMVPNSLAAISHGDDMLMVRSDVDSVIQWIEVDISSCDASHTDRLFQVMHYECANTWGRIADEAFSQCAKPIIAYNPAARHEQLVLKSVHGMYLPSGSILTTYVNSTASALICLSCCLEPDIVNAAAVIGYDVTITRGSLEDMTFLSKSFYRSRGVMCAYTCLGTIARNLGRKTGDFDGKGKWFVSFRFSLYFRGVIQGWVNEPASHFMRALRYGESLPLGICDHDLDEAIVRRYYPDDIALGTDEYLDFVRVYEACVPKYGHVIAHPFIDRLVGKRYGLEPKCVRPPAVFRGPSMCLVKEESVSDEITLCSSESDSVVKPRRGVRRNRVDARARR